ncbi:hypothetical protein SAMN05216383_10347 [Prevotella sp. KH2C16]|nr:hypothetical protein SAMN05216383_10347 [Prevotella sp. KH2C16]
MFLCVCVLCSCQHNYIKDKTETCNDSLIQVKFNLSPERYQKKGLFFVLDNDTVHVYNRYFSDKGKNRLVLQFSISLDSIIIHEYQTCGIKSLLSKYCEIIQYDKNTADTVLRNQKDFNRKWTIIYVLSKHNLKYFKHDLTGYEVFRYTHNADLHEDK